MLEQRSEAGIDTVLNIAGFDASLANLESSLGEWIRRALAVPDLMTGLSLLRQNLEKAIFEGRITLPDRFRAFRPDHYARRLIFADPVAEFPCWRWFGRPVKAHRCTITPDCGVWKQCWRERLKPYRSS